MAQNSTDIDLRSNTAMPDTTSTETLEAKAGLIGILQIFAENLRLLLLVPLLLGAVAFAITLVLPPTYTATARFLPPQQQQSAAINLLQSLGGLAGAASGGLKSPSDQYVAFLKTNAVLDLLVQKFDLVDRYEKKYKQDAREALIKRTKVVSSKENIITIEVDDKDAEFAASLANAYIQELGVLLTRLAVTEAQQRRVFFEKQLDLSKNNLVKAEQVLSASGVSTSALNASLATALEVPARLRAQITALEVRLASMRSYLSESAPEFKQVQSELSANRNQLARAEKEQPGASRGTNDYIAKLREVKYQETLFDLFSRQYEVAKIDESREGAVIQVVDLAAPPEKKSKPNRLVTTLLVVIGSGAAIFLYLILKSAILRSRRDPLIDTRLSNLRAAFARSLGRSSRNPNK